MENVDFIIRADRRAWKSETFSNYLARLSIRYIKIHKLNRGNREKVQQFMSITGTSEKVAVQALKASDWHLEGAFDAFYSQPQSRTYTDSRHLEELYNRYKGEQYLSNYFSF
uniref:Uncharacterized protein n=1 Tax=Populus tomentosa TaxID=118781 RepID=A0A1L6K4L6_POPTO|nr:hypothetical protein [Populus tomentosa]